MPARGAGAHGGRAQIEGFKAAGNRHRAVPVVDGDDEMALVVGDEVERRARDRLGTLHTPITSHVEHRVRPRLEPGGVRRGALGVSDEIVDGRNQRRSPAESKGLVVKLALILFAKGNLVGRIPLKVAYLALDISRESPYLRYGNRPVFEGPAREREDRPSFAVGVCGAFGGWWLDMRDGGSGNRGLRAGGR